MPVVDFIISNNGHHTAMFLPVVKAIASEAGYRCRVLSLCGFRGLPSPAEKFRMERVTFIDVLPFKVRRSSSSGGQSGGRASRLARQLARGLSWQFLLKKRMESCFETPGDLVVLPNDMAFPYDHICRLLKLRRTPFLLVQEGIRFPTPLPDFSKYGKAGAVAIAAWGRSSADFFRRVGVPDHKIFITGNPRFDCLGTTDWRAEAERVSVGLTLRKKNLLYLSNPVDDQGFCTTQEKLEIFSRFMEGIAPLFDDPEFYLIVKLHTRESSPDFSACTAELPFRDRIAILNGGPLYPLFSLVQAVIVLASTTGLEALLFNLPVGVLEIPGAGFVHDYVSSGAARGLTWQSPLAPQVQDLFNPGGRVSELAGRYVEDNLAELGRSTERIVGLIRDLTAEAGSGRPSIIGG